jgi:S1-C subfamily serine protease
VVVQRGGPPGSFFLAEVGVALVPDEAGDAARVAHGVEPEQRLAAYREVDLAAGDRILAVNGKRVRSAEEVKAAYEAVAVGAQVELGVERGADRRIVRFPKGDPAKMPQPRRVELRIHPDPDAEIEAMPALGIVIQQKHAAGSPVEVVAVLPNGETTFRQGDRVVGLDGKPVDDMNDFAERWDRIAVGAKVTIELENGGKRRTESFERRESPMMRREIRQ